MQQTSSKKIPVFIFGLVIFFMIIDFIFITIASQTYTGLYTENYFQKGVDVDKLKNQAVYKESTKWKEIVTLDFTNTNLAFKLTDHNGQPIANAQVTAKVLRPVTNKYDFLIELKEIEPGVYQSAIKFPEAGQWDIRIKAKHNNQEFITTKKVLIN